MPPNRILIVEDEPVLAENLRQYLARRSPDVRAVGDGEHAVALLGVFAPDAIIMDYGLPGMDGLETYAEIARRRSGAIDCVMITGSPSEALAARAHGEGVRHLLCKPFSFSELAALLDYPSAASERENEP